MHRDPQLEPDGFWRISDEQASGLLSLSLHPLSLSIAAGQTGATRLGREVGGEKAQTISHSGESIATPRRGDKQRCLMIRMRTVYNALTGSSMQVAALSGEATAAQKKARGAGAAPSRPIDSPTGANVLNTPSRPRLAAARVLPVELHAELRDPRRQHGRRLLERRAARQLMLIAVFEFIRL
jgi:hypothetical protein